MLDFSTFIVEEEVKKEGKKLKHLDHVDRLHLNYGHDGAATSEKHMMGFHNKLLGKNENSIHASTKYDGAPSVIFGQHPETGKFFVSTKSAHNKNPKINYTDEDVDINHGHAPGLAEKMKYALKHLPSIMPRHGGVYQGDLMHTEGDATTNKGMTSITPNSITYSAPSDSAEGIAMRKKKLGIVVHTKDALTDAKPLDDKTRAKFKEHPEVNNINPTMEVNPNNYTPDEQKEFLSHMNQARKTYASMKPESMDALEGHNVNLEGHVNDMVRTGGKASTDGYMKHMANRLNKKIETLKTQSAKDKYISQHADLINHITQNKEHFDKAFKLHHHLKAAKEVLNGVVAKNSPYGHSMNGVESGPEGTVVVDKEGNASKFVPNTFSSYNLTGGRFQKGNS